MKISCLWQCYQSRACGVSFVIFLVCMDVRGTGTYIMFIYVSKLTVFCSSCSREQDLKIFIFIIHSLCLYGSYKIMFL